MDVARKLACPHCRKILPDFCDQEILECEEFPLRCQECRQVVVLPAAYIEQVRLRLNRPPG
mgnify:FL=1